MTTSTAGALGPLQRGLLRRAGDAAAAIRAQAQEHARAGIDAAQQEATAWLALARSNGEADAAQLQAEDRGRARRAAREIVLVAQQAVYEDLRSRAVSAAGELLAEPDQHRRLAAMVLAQLGPGASVRDQPGGGVIGEAPDGRRIDATARALVERALAGIDLQPLWSPR